ncbi:GntR family transcriptional regulator [Boseongicola aestuarii]|uniref:Putative HTH-type transcriptional regulator YdfH n=1 Tax=Boseongicola aestuarii TaxID=1470561 RepID=A0A238J6K6_9RHOB|nr:GntR family transcriptional regulator [Boseongicola aestuarii]SMX25590.1 putative HTH-type transcriptional regulator YdfH [Boseongicola aestuarii]
MALSASKKPQKADAPITKDTIANALSHAIHQHWIAPGTKLGEDELSDIYGVSRTIVRAALQTLAHQQIVEIRRNRGAFIAKPSLTEAHEVFEARELLEPRTARSAARLATPQDIDLLEGHIAQEHDALKAGNHGRALFLSGQFHLEVARIAQQQTIADMIKVLIARSSLIIALYWRRESALCESQAHHALIKAIADQDGDHAEDLMKSHLVDLHSALNLREQPAVQHDLRDLLLKPSG